MKILDSKKCNQPDWLMNMVSDVMICAGTEDGSLDACQVINTAYSLTIHVLRSVTMGTLRD